MKANIDEEPKDKVPEPAVTQKRWHVNETSATRTESAHAIPNAVDGSKELCCDKVV